MDELLALRAGLVFDGERALGPAMVLIAGGKIVDVDTSGAVPSEIATVMDLGPDTCLMPGLIDAHVHLAFDASLDVVGALARIDDEALLAEMQERAEIVAAGPPLTTPRGHCHFLGGEVEGRQGLRAAVRERAERGCDVVKVMVSGGNITPGSKPHESQYGLDDLRSIVDEAQRTSPERITEAAPHP